MFDLISPHISGTSAGDCGQQHICYMFLLNPTLNRLRGTTCEFTDATQSWEAMTSAQWVTSYDWYSWSLRHHHGPRGSTVYHAHKAGSPVSSAAYSVFYLLPSSRSLQLCELKATPTPFPLEFAEVWLSMEMTSSREKNERCEREKVNKRETASTVFCYSHVSQTASTLHSSARDKPAIPPFIPSCLPAAVKSYEVVMSLVVMSLSLNLTSHWLSKRLKETSQQKHFYRYVILFFSAAHAMTLHLQNTLNFM